MAVVSISRQFGAGGQTLAKKLAERIGYEFVDDELISKVAEKAGIPVDYIDAAWKEAGMKSRSVISGLIDSDLFKSVFRKAKPGFSEKEFYNLLEELIPEIASRDKVIFLGRGSQFILPDNETTIKVLLVGHEKNRVKFMMENYDLTRSEAQKMVMNWDKRRVAFLKKYSTGDPNDLSNYHLTINTDKINLDACVDMICNITAARDRSIPLEVCRS